MKDRIKASAALSFLIFVPTILAFGFTYLASHFALPTALLLSLSLFCFFVEYRFSPWKKHSTYMSHADGSLFDRAYCLYPRGYEIYGNRISITSTPFSKSGKQNPSFKNVFSDSAKEYFLDNLHHYCTFVRISSYNQIPFYMGAYLSFPFSKIDASDVHVVPNDFSCIAYYNSTIEEIVLPYGAPLCLHFEHCCNLQRLVVLSPTPPAVDLYLNPPCIAYCHPDIALYVPIESLNEYQNHPSYQRITVKHKDGTIVPIPIKPIPSCHDA